MVSLDYKEIGEYVGEVTGNVTTLIVRDEQATVIAAFVVNANGGVEQVKGIFEFMKSPGYDTISLKIRNEDATEVVRDEAVNKRKALIVPAGSVPYRPGSHGIAERVVQDVTAQFSNSHNIGGTHGLQG